MTGGALSVFLDLPGKFLDKTLKQGVADSLQHPDLFIHYATKAYGAVEV
jgi:hypothetical protein